MTARDPLPGLPARWPFLCPRCDQPGEVGDRIVHQRGAYVHVACCSGSGDE